MRACLSWLAMLAVGTASALAEMTDLTFTAYQNELRAFALDGTLVWRANTTATDALSIARGQDESLELSDGTIWNSYGRLIGRKRNGVPMAASGQPEQRARAAAWDPLAEITPPPPSGTSDAHNPPSFDAAGNAWVIITNIVSGQYTLKVRRSDGHTGLWGPLEPISNTTAYVAGPEGIRDPHDNVTVAFRDISGGYKLYALRYVPDVGWGPLQLIHSTASFFQAIEIGCDAAGNVAVVFDQEVGSNAAAWTAVYNAASGSWSPAQQVSPAGCRVRLPTVICNAARDAMYLVYLASNINPAGLYAHTWDSAARAWGPAQYLPGSGTAGYSGAGPASRLPGVVDAAGEATVFWGSPYVPHASRTSGGVWQEQVELFPLGMVDIENFAGAAVNAAGDVFGIASRFDTGSNRLYVFRYDSGVGWQPAENPYTSSVNLATRVRVAFYQGRRAVATVLGSQAGVRQITSLLFDGSTWSPDILDIPAQEDAFFSDLTSDRGEVLLVYEGEVGGANRGIKATWLRDPHPGDLNCDGLVDFGDVDPFVEALSGVTTYHAQYPECDHRNADCNADGAVDFADISPFVEILSGG